MNFDNQIQKEYRIFHKSLVVFNILLALVLIAFIYWLQVKFGFFGFI